MTNFGGGWIAIGLLFFIITLAIFKPSSSVGYIDIYSDSTFIAQRSGINIIGGNNVTATAADDPTNNRSNITLDITKGTANQLLQTNAGATSTEWTSPITPDRLDVDNLIINDNKLNTDSDIDYTLQQNGENIITIQDSASAEGNSNIYFSQNKFDGTGRAQISAFDGTVPYDAVTPPPTTILTAAEMMSASNKYMSGLAIVFSKHSGHGAKWSNYLLMISSRSAAGGSITTISTDTVSGGCALTFGFDPVTYDIQATNNTSVDCNVGVTFFGLGAFQE